MISPWCCHFLCEIFVLSKFEAIKVIILILPKIEIKVNKKALSVSAFLFIEDEFLFYCSF